MSELFEKLCQRGLLSDAWSAVKAKRSSGGIDGMSIADFEEKAYQYISELLAELEAKNRLRQSRRTSWLPNAKKNIRNARATAGNWW